jgi:LPXTG-motif cell wall-anchored protein
MRRLCAMLTAGILAFAGLLVASPAQAYPNVQVTITSVVEIGGRNVTIRAEVDPPGVSCDFTLTYQGAKGTKTVTSKGSSISHTFQTFEVKKRTVTTTTATCLYDDSTVPQVAGAFGGLPAAVIAAPQTASATGTVTLLPLRDGDDSDDDDDSDGDEDDDNGGLPNTGGERLAWLIIGLLLVVAGTTVVVTSRKQTETS